MKLNKSKRNEFVLHILVWIMLFTIPYLLTRGDEILFSRMIEHNWIPLVFYGITFYLNYLFLIDRYFFVKKFKAYILINMVMIIVFAIIVSQLKHLLFTPFDMPPPNQSFSQFKETRPPKNIFVYMDFIWSIVPVGFAFALKSFEKLRLAETHQKETEKVKLEQELQYLRYQLQPHFFFNSLNNIYSLVDIAPEKAKESIHGLSKLMRFLLYDSNTEKITLKKEIDFLTTYIELMKLRFSEKTVVSYQFPDVKESSMIAPLLFISLVENAFKHGISATKNSEISFAMKNTEKGLEFVSKNSYFPKNQKDKSGSGIGLANLDKRLSLLFPGKYKLSTNIENNQYVATLIIDEL